MKKTIFILTLVAAFTIITTAQTKPGRPQATPTAEPPPPAATIVSPCPHIEIRAAKRQVRDGEAVGIAIALNGGDPKVEPTFYWSVSAGMISAGQGTRSIEVDSTGAGADKAITASLLIGGYSSECAYDASTTVDVAGPPVKLDEYATLPESDEKTRLDAFIANITDKEQAYIFAYAGRTSPRGQANADLKRIRTYLLTAGAQASRLVTIDGGFREAPIIELWTVPIGAEAPRSTPTLHAKDIVYPKTAPIVKKP